MEQCQICGKQLRNKNGLAKHIHNQHKDFTKQKYYDAFIGITSPVCKTCGKPECTFRDIGIGYLTFCSESCYQQNLDVAQERRARQLGKIQTQETIDKRRNSILEKYGVPNGFLTKKNKPETYKGFCCRSSYEKIFVDFSEKFGLTLSIPEKINYEFLGRNRWYFPDFFINELQTLIEVKSKWTFNLHKEMNTCKIQAAKLSGFKILVIDEDSGLLDNWEKLNEHIHTR